MLQFRNSNSEMGARDHSKNRSSSRKLMSEVISILLAIFAIAIFSFSSCGKDDEKAKTLASIEVTTQPTKKTYTIGDKFEPAGMVVTATYSDKTTSPVTVTAAMLSYDFMEAGDNKTVTVSFEYEGTTEMATVNGITVKAVDLPFEGVGTVEVPFQIDTPEQFLEFAEFVNSRNPDDGEEIYFKQTADIHLGSISASSLKSSSNWTPIGSKDIPFTGTYDGNNFKVTGLYVEFYIDSISNGGGLFGYIDGGSVMNLHVEGKVVGNDVIGGVTGYVDNGGSITNCYADVEVIGLVHTGGVVGQIRNGSSVTNCYAAGSISGSYAVGGIAGAIIDSRITDCYATCSVSGIGGGNLDSRIGGIAGEVMGSIGGVGIATNCYATGAVSGNSEVGGIVGCIPSSGSITNCAALNISITRTGSGSSTEFGRVAGKMYENFTLTNNVAYSGMTVLGVTVASGEGATTIQGRSISAASARNKATYTGTGSLGWLFDGSNPWKMGVGTYGLPVLSWQTSAPTTIPEHLRN